MGIAPFQSVPQPPMPAAMPGPEARLIDELWAASDGGVYGLTRAEFGETLMAAGASQNFGVAAGAATEQDREAWLRAIKANDLVLARACGAGNERAWERFVALHHEPLTRAAIAITGSDTLGREMAGALYAELYGLTERDGVRRCPLDSYRGRGSLMGWLRTTLAQRHVDHHRKTHREQPLEDGESTSDHGTHRIDPAAPEPESPPELARLGEAVSAAIAERDAEERFLLAAYYLDDRTLSAIAQVLHVHEATVSRRLKRAIEDVRKQVLRYLQRAGLSRRAAEEALGADPRDLELNWKRLLQNPTVKTFQEQAATRETTG